MNVTKHTVSRRGFIKAGGALVVVSAAVPAGLSSSLAQAVAAGEPFPTPNPALLSTWLAVKADGTVITRSGHVDLGQGNQTALAQIVAEELDVPFEKISMVMGDTNKTPDQGTTAGSTTIRVAGAQLRLIAAEGRATLLKMASEKLGAPVSELKVKNGVVSHGSKKVSYAQLVQGQALTAATPIKIEGSSFDEVIKVGATPKDPSEYTIVGKPIPRVDIPLKVSGHNTFVQDVKVPGMLHARMVHPPAFGAQVISVGGFSTPIPGASVVRKADLVAVVAQNEWDAIKGAEALQVKWTSWNGLPDSNSVYSVLQAMKGQISVVTNIGNAAAAFASAPTTITSTYTTPFENHGMLGPSCAVADVRSGSATIYSQTQYPQGLQQTIAGVLGMSPGQVEVLWYDGAGCYGREGDDDAAPEAAILSQMVGKPVRVQWMRPDEHIWEPHGPGTVHAMKAGLDSNNNLVSWQHEAWMPPNNDDRTLGPLLARQPVGGPVPIGGWTGPNLYRFPNSYEFAHELFEVGAATSPYGAGIRTTYLRSPGQYQITYAQEAFVDEIASAAGVDALQFRLQNLTDPRAIAVLQQAAKVGGWETRPSPKWPNASTTSGPVSGQGIALVLRDGTYAAGVVTLTVDPSSGKIQLGNVTIAQDSGLVINPMAVKHQIQSSVIQTASRAIHEEVTFNTSTITSTNWSTYPILTMAETPQKINYVLIDHPEIASTGVGEPAVNVMPSAISSAIFDATGVRIRALPMTPKAVKKALAAGPTGGPVTKVFGGGGG